MQGINRRKFKDQAVGKGGGQSRGWRKRNKDAGRGRCVGKVQIEIKGGGRSG